jgi:hypothetical protein
MFDRAKKLEDWLGLAFDLAYFIHGNRDVARKVAVNAIAKLEVMANAQYKRLYYTPRASRSKVFMNDLQLLQRLVYVESEFYERRKEASADLSFEDLVIHYIKHLVRISVKRNSFYGGAPKVMLFMF